MPEPASVAGPSILSALRKRGSLRGLAGTLISEHVLISRRMKKFYFALMFYVVRFVSLKKV